MMYKKCFAAAIMLNGSVLKEDGEKVYLPFSSEYSIYLKNLNFKKTLVDINIDGSPAIKGLVIPSRSNVTVERFLNDNMSEGNRFKFIKRTKEIENHRGINVFDGIVEIVFAVEKDIFPNIINKQYYNHYYSPSPYYNPFFDPNWGGTGDFNTLRNFTVSNNMGMAVSCSNSSDVGVTTKGSISNQKFIKTDYFATEESDVIVFHLLGREKEIYSSDKIQCNMCGKKWKNFTTFCGNCGTYLI